MPTKFTYNPAQELLGYTAGNGVQATLGYSPQRLQLQTLSYQKGVNTLFSLGYGYTQPNNGNNGQITAITDNVTANNSLTFTDDALGRLTRGKLPNLTVPNSWDISWTYDRYGNRTKQTLTGGTLAVTNQNLTFNSNNQPTGGFAFDLSGNMTDDAVTHNYVYDAENRFVKLGSTVANTYDGSGMRIEKVTGGTTTVYVFSGMQVIAEYSPSAATSAPSEEYVYLGSRPLATLNSSHNPTYRQSDHLSVRLFTDANGNVIGTQGHLPFGEAWYSTGTVDKWKFTTYEQDSDTNLDYAVMRFDSARLGRFMSPDPYGGSADPETPQSWNRYAYVLNDPCTMGDPLGLQGCVLTVGGNVHMSPVAQGEIERIFKNIGVDVSFGGLDGNAVLEQNVNVLGAFGIQPDGTNLAEVNNHSISNAVAFYQPTYAPTDPYFSYGAALGRTASHEIGHIFLGTGHSTTGLMRSGGDQPWEINQDLFNPLKAYEYNFTDRQGAIIRSKLGCRNSESGRGVGGGFASPPSLSSFDETFAVFQFWIVAPSEGVPGLAAVDVVTISFPVMFFPGPSGSNAHEEDIR